MCQLHHPTTLPSVVVSLYAIHGTEGAQGYPDLTHLNGTLQPNEKYTKYSLYKGKIYQGGTLTWSMGSQHENAPQQQYQTDMQPLSHITDLPPFVKAVWVTVSDTRTGGKLYELSTDPTLAPYLHVNGMPDITVVMGGRQYSFRRCSEFEAGNFRVHIATHFLVQCN